MPVAVVSGCSSVLHLGLDLRSPTYKRILRSFLSLCACLALSRVPHCDGDGHVGVDTGPGRSRGLAATALRARCGVAWRAGGGACSVSFASCGSSCDATAQALSHVGTGNTRCRDTRREYTRRYTSLQTPRIHIRVPGRDRRRAERLQAQRVKDLDKGSAIIQRSQRPQCHGPSRHAQQTARQGQTAPASSERSSQCGPCARAQGPPERARPRPPTGRRTGARPGRSRTSNPASAPRPPVRARSARARSRPAMRSPRMLTHAITKSNAWLTHSLAQLVRALSKVSACECGICSPGNALIRALLRLGNMLPQAFGCVCAIVWLQRDGVMAGPGVLCSTG